jgi:hypothetical protein
MEAGRRLAESLMVDSCTIRRRTGTTTDPDTGDVTPTFTVLYTGQKCRVQTRGNWGEAKDIGEAALVLLTVEIQLPISVTGVDVRDEVTIDVCANDAELTGREFRVKDLNHKSHATMRRLMGTEVTG